MNRNHALLTILGVNTKELQKLINAALKHAYGAKLTGAGGGGSIVALTDEPEKVCRAIIKAGGNPIVVRPATQGVRIEFDQVTT